MSTFKIKLSQISSMFGHTNYKLQENEAADGQENLESMRSQRQGDKYYTMAANVDPLPLFSW